MRKPPLDPNVADWAPTSTVLTGYDEQHLVTYLRLLDAAEDGADWREVSVIVLHIDPECEPDRARRAWETHLARARWMTERGYRHLLRGGRAALTALAPTGFPRRDTFPSSSLRAGLARRPNPGRHTA